MPLDAVVAIYARAKMLELADHQVFELIHGLVSGNNLKHIVAALAAVAGDRRHAQSRHSLQATRRQRKRKRKRVSSVTVAADNQMTAKQTTRNSE